MAQAVGGLLSDGLVEGKGPEALPKEWKTSAAGRQQGHGTISSSLAMYGSLEDFPGACLSGLRAGSFWG